MQTTGYYRNWFSANGLKCSIFWILCVVHSIWTQTRRANISDLQKNYFISHIFIAFSKISYLRLVLFSFPPFYARYRISRAPLANFIVMPYKSARVRQGKGSVTFPSCVTILNVCLGVCVPRTVLLTLYKLSLSLSLCFCSLSMWASAATSQQLSCNNQRERRCQTFHKCVISGKLNR